ncbi:MAG: sulfatase-like hydrolase/transferase, partial [Bacteroidaceae bacterium]
THAQFAAMITRLDTYVGEIITKLKEKGLDENTIIIFSSDNGPHEEGGADPSFFNRDGILRGLKRQTYEGGIRVPFIVKWPGKIKANTLNNLPIAFWDIMPTFCDILGLKNYEKKYSNKNKDADYFDGISFLPSLLGKNKKQKYHDFLYWEFNETNQVAVRQGDWKLISKSGKCHLYNLARDIHEDNDLSSQYPEIVNQLVDIAHKQHTPNQFFHVTMPGQKK